jgi:hypothetical protein
LASLFGTALQADMDIVGKISDQNIRHACIMLSLRAERKDLKAATLPYPAKVRRPLQLPTFFGAITLTKTLLSKPSSASLLGVVGSAARCIVSSLRGFGRFD